MTVIYLDHNATTPVLPEVVEAMLPYLREEWGNPSSTYRFGAKLKKTLEIARDQVADLIGAHPMNVVFTSGGTESDNAALHAIAHADPNKRHLITSNVEHSAVLSYCRYLEGMGWRVTYLAVDREGLLSMTDLENAITPETAGVSLMWANNETGVLFPVEEIAAICQGRGVLFHCDAVQAVGKILVNFSEIRASFLSLSGHKFGAPKGIGALVVADPDSFVPMVVGGKQENGHRGGTENVPSIVALGTAAEIATVRNTTSWSRVAKLRDSWETKVQECFPGAEVNGAGRERLPNTSNIYLPGIDADALVTFLDQKAICVSSGSACLESAITPSHVILGMSGSHERASESIRISLGRDTRADEVDHLLLAFEAFREVSG